MALSVFEDKNKPPGPDDLKRALGKSYRLWSQLKDFVREQYPGVTEEWGFSGKAYGWGFRLKDKKRAILYLTPCDGCFKASFVFGEKATDEIRRGKFSPDIIAALEAAPVYAEGRGFRIDVKDESLLEDIRRLILVKLKY